MSFHKVIFKPITTAQRNLHFYDLYAHFRTPLSSHIQIPKKNVPKTLLLQMPIYSLIRSILFFLLLRVKGSFGFLSKMAKTDFFNIAPVWSYRPLKLVPKKCALPQR